MSIKMKSSYKILIVISSLIILGFILLKFSARDKENVGQVIAHVVTSWSERAEQSARITTEKSKTVLAKSIVGTLHPTADNPNMDSFDVERNGDVITVYYNCSYSGGLSGSNYALRLKWSFSENQNFGVLLISDSSPFAAATTNLNALKDYFQSEVYSVVIGNTH